MNGLLAGHYGIVPKNIKEQQGGWCCRAFRIDAPSSVFFLKAYEKSQGSTARWTVAINEYTPVLKWLGEGPLKGNVPIPVLTVSGEYSCEDSRNVYLLYEYVEGQTIGGIDLPEGQTDELADIIARLHAIPIDDLPQTTSLSENFRTPFLKDLKLLLDTGDHALLSPFEGKMQRLIRYVEERGLSFPDRNLKFVPCHTDVHNWNLLAGPEKIVLLDWEGLKLAPPEADLALIKNWNYYASFMKSYLRRRPDFAADREVLDFYIFRRRLEDIWEFLERIGETPENSPERNRVADLLVQNCVLMMEFDV